MPSPKQVRHHFKQLSKAHDRMIKVLNAAHLAGVIDYPRDTYQENAPCWANGELWNRIKKTTEKQLAQAMRDEIYRSMR